MTDEPTFGREVYDRNKLMHLLQSYREKATERSRIELIDELIKTLAFSDICETIEQPLQPDPKPDFARLLQSRINYWGKRTQSLSKYMSPHLVNAVGRKYRRQQLKRGLSILEELQLIQSLLEEPWTK